MKIDLVSKIKDLVDAHRTNDEQCIEAMAAVLEKWKSPELANKYTREFIAQAMQEELDETLTSSVNVDVVLNQKLKAIIAKAKEQLMPVYFKDLDKPADYAVQVSNALKFLEYEDDELTDESAYIILKPFLDDYEQMRLFKNVIQKKVNIIDGYGKSTLPKTFEKLKNIEMFMNILSEIEMLLNSFSFIQKDGESFGFFGTSSLSNRMVMMKLQLNDIGELAESVEEMQNHFLPIEITFKPKEQVQNTLFSCLLVTGCNKKVNPVFSLVNVLPVNFNQG